MYNKMVLIAFEQQESQFRAHTWVNSNKLLIMTKDLLTFFIH